jgi:hypothetical protein
MTGLVDAAEVLAGEAATNVIAGYIPVTGAALQAAAKVGAAVIVAYVGKKFVGANFAKMALAGGLAAVIRGPVKAANIPIVSAALGDADYYAVGAYPQGALPGVGAYPQAYAGDDEDAFVQY